MYIAHVFVHVKPDAIEAFKSASVENALNSLREPGIARFDLIQERKDPSRFVLVEVYRTEADTHRHKETGHYRKWRDTVAPMMAEPRHAITYVNIHPGENEQDGADAI